MIKLTTIIAAAFLLFVCFLLPDIALAQPGANDPTFNPTDFGFGNGDGANNTIWTTAIQSDGKIIIGGDFTSYNGTGINRIARLNSDGTFDATFNPGIGANSTVQTTAIQSDGKIIIGGNFSFYNGIGRICIARLNSNGTLDATFNPGNGPNNPVRTTAIQSDGKIIIGGVFSSYDFTARNYIARLNADGTLDATFDPGTGANNAVWTTTIQNDGKIILGGAFTSYNGTGRNYIARLNSDGTLEATFNPGMGANNLVRTSAIQSDGKIIIGGYFTSYNGIGINRIARLNSNGTIDGTFNAGTGANNFVTSTAIQSDGKIIIGGGFTSYNGTGINRIARLNSNGTLDANFNPGIGANNTVLTTAIQSDGKIIIGGDFNSYNGTAIYRISRLNSDGSIDGTFNPGMGANGFVLTTAIQIDGKIIIGGDFISYNGIPRNKIVRMNSDGSLDTTFIPGTGANNSVHTTAIQSDGKIIIGGQFTYFNGTASSKIARLNSDGTIDGTFTGTGANSWVYTTAIQSDGKIIIGGNFTSYNGTGINRIARLNSDGTIDGTFNAGTGANNLVTTTAIQNDGKIIIGGYFNSYNGIASNKIARLNSDGTIDGTFNPGTGANNTVKTTAIQSDGKIIIGGQFTYYNGTAINTIARLNSDGTLDSTFNSGTGANIEVTATAIQSDGKIIIGGYFTSYNGIARNYIARLNSDGTLDATFNPGTGANNSVYTTAIQSDGKIIIGGLFTSYNGTGRNRIARIKVCIPTASALNQTACDNYTLNSQTYTATGTYSQTLTNAAGCDSAITLNLTINNNSGSQNIIACDSYTWAANGNTYAASGIQTAVLTNVAGCDSTATLNLTINNSSSGSQTVASCNSYTWPANGNTYTASGVQTAVLSNMAGCDSTVTLNLTINNSNSSSQNITACDSYTWPVNGNTYTASGVQTAVLTNIAGCDSTTTLNLTINTVDLVIILNGSTLTANATGATYQWVDCNNGNQAIANETNQSFTASANGDYAVLVTENGCSDTSACVNIITVGIEQVVTGNKLSLYPNPVRENITLVSSVDFNGAVVKVITITGQTLIETTINSGNKHLLNMSSFAPGLYFIEVNQNGKMKRIKVMKN